MLTTVVSSLEFCQCTSGRPYEKISILIQDVPNRSYGKVIKCSWPGCRSIEVWVPLSAKSMMQFIVLPDGF